METHSLLWTEIYLSMTMGEAYYYGICRTQQLANATPFADSLDFWCSSELLSHVPEWCQHLSGQRQSVRLVVDRTLLVVFTFICTCNRLD